MKEIKAFLHGVVQERDRLRQQLEGEIKQRGQEDEDLRKKLKVFSLFSPINIVKACMIL